MLGFKIQVSFFRFYDSPKGQVLIDEQPLVDYSRESIRTHMGIVLQEPYSGIVASNVSMNDLKITDETVEEALEKVGTEELIDKLPNGIHGPGTHESLLELGQYYAETSRLQAQVSAS